MARARRKTGDDATNARKRYARQANNYLKQADNATSPAMKQRYQQLARQSAENALGTYSKDVPYTKMRKDVREVALRTGAEFPSVTDKRRESMRSALIDLEGDTAKGALASKKRTTEQRREFEAKSLLSGHVGHRILGSLSEIWQGVTDTIGNAKEQIESAIFDFLGVDSWMGVIEKFEEVFGEDLYAEPENEFKYDAIVNSAVEKLGKTK